MQADSLPVGPLLRFGFLRRRLFLLRYPMLLRAFLDNPSGALKALPRVGMRFRFRTFRGFVWHASTSQALDSNAFYGVSHNG